MKKILFAIICIPVLILVVYMTTPKAEAGTTVEREELAVIEKKAIETETKVAEVDIKVTEIANVQAEQSKQIESIKTEVQQVKTTVVPVAKVEPVIFKIDYCKELQNYLSTGGFNIFSIVKRETHCNISFTANDGKRQVGNYGVQFYKETETFATHVDNKLIEKGLSFEQAKAFIEDKRVVVAPVLASK
jgi:regulator of sigma D